MALVTAAEVRSWVGIPSGDPPTDDTIDLLVDAVSVAAETFCGRKFASTAVDEYLTGDGTSVLFLPNAPVITLTTLSIEGGTALVAGWDKDYVLVKASGLIRLTAGVFPSSPGGIHAVYTAGYATIPADLKLSILKACAFDLHAQDKRRQGITHMTTPSQSADYIEDEYPKDVLEVWKRYRRMVIA